MSRSVEISMPETASSSAHARVPDHVVPRVAAALRATRRDSVDDRDDETYVADCLMDYLRAEVARWSHRERSARALRDAEPEVDW